LSKTLVNITIFVLLSLVFFACHPELKVAKRGGYVLVKNTIKNNNSYLPYDELEGFIQQSSMPGRLAPYFRPGIYFYEYSYRGKETKFKLFIRKSFGEKPIILDTLMVQSSVDKLNIYLRNKGFYHAEILSSVDYKRRKSSVTYKIKSGTSCILN